MAKRTTTTTKKATTTATTNGTTPNKSQAVRDYAKAHPDAKPAEIAKALEADGIEVSASRVSSVLTRGTAGGKVSVAEIKLAATVLAEAGSLDEAVSQLEAAGSVFDLLKACKSIDNAKAALEQASELQSVFG